MAGGLDMETAPVHLALEVFLEKWDGVFDEENAESAYLVVGDILENMD
jgi:hypothetical protein